MSKLAALAAAVALVLFPVLAHAETSIVDSNGVLVGILNGNGNALRQLPDGQWVTFPVGQLGLIAFTSLVAPGANISQWYASSDCTGTPYLEARDLPAQGIVINPNVVIDQLLYNEQAGFARAGTLYYPAKPLSSSISLSFQSILLAQPYSRPPICESSSAPANLVVGEERSVNLKFSPPFRIK